MDRLLAMLARLISHRSFTEECVSGVAAVPLRAAICAMSVAVLRRISKGRAGCHGSLSDRETASLKDVAT